MDFHKVVRHYVARELAALGHNVRQVPPTYAKPFRQGHKNDYRDALAVAEAVQRPTTRFVPPKSNEQLDLQAPHRVWSRLVSQRTAVNPSDSLLSPGARHHRSSFANYCPTFWPSERTCFPHA